MRHSSDQLMEMFKKWINETSQIYHSALTPYKFSQVFGIEENEAVLFFQELVDRNYLMPQLIVECPNCREECTVAYTDLSVDYECDECSEEFTPNNVHKKDIYYSANLDEINRTRLKKIDPIELLDYTDKHNVISISHKKDMIIKEQTNNDYKGEQQMSLEKNDKFQKIFISHSENDKNIVTKLIRLLHDIGVPKKQNYIFCSSYEGYNVPLSQDISDYIREQFNENMLVLFVLSKNFYESPACLCEMGATWVKTKKHIPILIPPFSFPEIKGFIRPTISGLTINDKLKLNELKNIIVEGLELEGVDQDTWERDKEEFLGDINHLLDNK